VSYLGLLARTWSENLLYSALIELTYRCNLDCFYCYNDTALNGKPLSREQYLALFADLRELGAAELILSGGEPLAHPDFFALGAAARESRFLVKVKSNGHALRGRLLARLKSEVDPFVVEVSLHGATAATHDRQTRVPGSFERLMDNLRQMQAAELRLKINCTLTAWNAHELEAIYALGDGLGLAIQVNPQVTPRDNGDMEPLDISPSREAIARWMEVLRQRSAQAVADFEPVARPAPPSKQCGAGSSTVSIDPYGNVYPCVQWRRPLGNLHEQSLKDIWQHSEALTRVREQTAEARVLVEGLGEAGRHSGYCAGVAELNTGNAVSLYPEARLRLDIARRGK